MKRLAAKQYNTSNKRVKEMNEQLRQAKEYFKSGTAYAKLFNAFRQKYESLGRIGGTVSVRDFTKKELEEIGRFFGIPDGQIREKGSISLRDFENQIQHTRFSELSLKNILDSYFGETIISKREQLAIREDHLNTFIQTLITQFPKLTFWFTYILEQKKEGRWILQLAEQDPVEFKRLVVLLDRAFENLPQKAERLPLFSQRITGDPHAFDLQTDLGRLFLYLLTISHGDTEFPTTTEEINRLLQRSNIYRDDLLNFVTCANVVAETKDGVHPVWEAATRKHSVQIVPLRELIDLTSVYPDIGKIVWVVENSGVCSTLLDDIPQAPIICTNGQFTLATLMLMDLLVENGAILYYAGDFDPEGLGMADRLIERYAGGVQLWHMNVSSYLASNPIKALSRERLEKLNSIKDARLVKVTEVMRKTAKAGYQEALMEQIKEDIRKHMEQL